MGNAIRFVRPIKILRQSYAYARKCVDQNDKIDAIVSEFNSTGKVKQFLLSLNAASKDCSVQKARISELYNDSVRKLMRVNYENLEKLIKDFGLPKSFSPRYPFSKNYSNWPK